MTWRRALRVASIAASVAAVLFGVRIGVDALRRARVDRIGGAAEDALRDVEACRWERPVVGGDARSCNGYEDAYAATSALFADAPEGDVATRDPQGAIVRGEAEPPEIAAFRRAHTNELADLRAAARCAWACARDVPKLRYRHGTLGDAVALLLFSAREAHPRECVARALDAMRLLQDDATGIAAIVPTPASREALERAALRSAVACALAPEAEGLDDAARDAVLIATTPYPVGEALALEARASAAPLVEAQTNPKRVGLENVLWVQRGALLDVADALVTRANALRAYRDDDFPMLFDRLEADAPRPGYVPFATHRPASYSPSAADIVEAPREALEAALRAAARRDRRLRLLAVAIAAARDRARDGAWPNSGPAERDDPRLRDPYSGAPFGWSLDESGVALLVDAAPGDPAAPAERVALAVHR